MKARALQLGRALNAALFVLLLSVAGTKNAFAQQTLVATLQHGDDISFFYGMDAFVNAHAAAETGDIITLSSGSFNPTTITKAITLRGAGFVTDTVSGTTPTVFSSAIVANVSDTENYLTIEGIRFNSSFTYKILNNPHFYKCYFSSFYNNLSSTTASQMTNAHFVNCRVKSFYFSDSKVYATNTSFINCVVWNLGGYYYDNGSSWCNSSQYIGGSVVAINSIIRLGTSPTAVNAVNSIVIGYPYSSDSYSLSGSSSATNCIGIKKNSSSAPNPLGSSSINSWLYTSLSSVFKASNTELYYHEHFDVVSLDLKESIANTCLGTDGTQVGIYGGVMPYTDHPAYMVIRHCNVANQTDAENKLSVEIEVLNDGE